jgi:hypothetical protein
MDADGRLKAILQGIGSYRFFPINDQPQIILEHEITTHPFVGLAIVFVKASLRRRHR